MTNQSVAARRRRRRRLALEAVLVSCCVIVVAWGLDRAARIGAESLLERDIQQVTGVAERPVVRLGSGPFVLQALSGAYRHAEVDVSGMRTGPLEIAHISARLTDVRLPLRDLLLRDIRRVGISYSEDVVTLRFDDLNAYFETTGRSLRLTADDTGQVRMTGSFDVLAQTVPVDASVELSVDGTQLRITPRHVDTGDATLSEAGRLLLDQRIALTVPMDGLPLGSQLTGVDVTADELQITAESRAVVLRP
jgi:hypothetical protein